MRWLPETLLVFVLATLLVVTTPIGTGEGVHQDQILHPVLPHLHMINGRIVSHDEADAAAAAAHSRKSPQPTAGPAVGAGAGAPEAGLGIAIYPNVPLSVLVLPVVTVGRAGAANAELPDEFLDAPPDPPPNLAG
jgi:hypothetical protein